jgi:hypothetical protein
VFEQLRAEQPGNVEYKVVRLEDGCRSSCVVSGHAGRSNRCPGWRRSGVRQDSAARVATTPVPTPADIIGPYYPAVPVTDAARTDRSRAEG